MNEDKSMEDQWYESYISLGGKSDRITFDKIRTSFEETCIDAYLGHVPMSRQDAWNNWRKITGITQKETHLCFEAIDNVTAVT